MLNIESYDLLATAVILLDEQGRVRYANISAEELFGLSRKQLLGAFGSALFGSDAMLEPRFLDAVHGKYGVLRRDITIRQAEAAVPASLVLVPLEGQPWSALLEIRGLDQHDQLDRTLQLSKELKVQRESLRNLAHEVKNPLGGIRGAAQLLEAELQPDHPLREYTSVVIAEADRLRGLIDRLIAPQEEGLSRLPFNIHEICERVYTLLRAEFSAQIDISRDYDASVPDLAGDPARLVQALLNIARNAAQALVPLGAGAGDGHAHQGPVRLVPHDLGAVRGGVSERDHPPVAGPPCRIEVGGVHHPRTDRPEQPDVVLPRLFEPLEPHIDDDVGADFAVQGDHRRHFVQVKDVDGLAADLAEHDVAHRRLADGRHHAALPAVQDLGGFRLEVEAMRTGPGLTAPTAAAPLVDVHVQQYRRADKAERGQREPERDHCA